MSFTVHRISVLCSAVLTMGNKISNQKREMVGEGREGNGGGVLGGGWGIEAT